eukprot:403374064
MSKKNQKRSLKETETVEIVQEDEEKITISKKKTTTMSRTTTKGQSSLSGFFGVTHNPSAKFHGDAKHEDFKSDQLNIWVWNINGLQAVINKGMLDVFLQGEDPDIVCFNEIKTDPEKIKSASFHTKIPKDYEQYWNCSKSKKGYSGTGLITKIKPIKVTFDIGIEEHDQEGRVITAEFSKFVLVAVYVPNSGDDLRRLSYRTQEWDKAFFDYLDRTRIETNKPLILTGDLNVARNELDVFDTKGKDKVACYTPEERKSFESFINRGYIDTFRHLYPDKREYTYFSARFNNKVTNKGWRIDYFVVHQDDINMVTDVTIHKDYNGSDHVPVCLHLDLSKIKKEEEEVKGVSKVKSKVRGKTPTKASKSKSRSKSKSARKAKDDDTESQNEDDDEEKKDNNALQESQDKDTVNDIESESLLLKSSSTVIENEKISLNDYESLQPSLKLHFSSEKAFQYLTDNKNSSYPLFGNAPGTNPNLNPVTQIDDTSPLLTNYSNSFLTFYLGVIITNKQIIGCFTAGKSGFIWGNALDSLPDEMQKQLKKRIDKEHQAEMTRNFEQKLQKKFGFGIDKIQLTDRNVQNLALLQQISEILLQVKGEQEKKVLGASQNVENYSKSKAWDHDYKEFDEDF